MPRAHYHVTSTYDDAEWVSGVPGARWSPRAKAWRVRKRWHRTLGRAIARHAAEWAETRARVAEDAARSGVDLATFDWLKPSSTAAGAWDVKTPYHDELVPRLRALGGRWFPKDRTWCIPADRVNDLILSAPTLDGYVREALDRMAAQQAEEERRAEARAWRLPVLLSDELAVGALVEVQGEPRAITGFGVVFEVSIFNVIAWGEQWAPHEGALVRYA